MAHQRMSNVAKRDGEGGGMALLGGVAKGGAEFGGETWLPGQVGGADCTLKLSGGSPGALAPAPASCRQPSEKTESQTLPREKKPWIEPRVTSLEQILARVSPAKVDGRYFIPGAREILADYWLFVSLTNRRPTRKEFRKRMPRWTEFFKDFPDLERVAVVGKKEEERAKREERGVRGLPLMGRVLETEPVNEQGVVLLFGEMAKELGFRVERIGTGFPDCRAARWVNGEWSDVRIEFEFLSSRFDHDPAGCDLVVCWENDWKECGVEVLALKEKLEEMKDACLRRRA